jgi:hypothetical protein
MIEHNYLGKTCHPAEGRCDIARDLDEEQRHAYSTHHKSASTSENVTTQLTLQQQVQQVLEPCHPAEGRCDIAANLDEEQCNAYSAHSARAGEKGK